MKKCFLLGLFALCLTLVQCSKDNEIQLDPKAESTTPVTPEATVKLGGNPNGITSDQPWNDIYGNRINAHGGGIYYENGFYYWYGEDATGWSYNGIHCYRSRDLINWNDLGIVMSVDPNNNNSDIRKGCIIQRPKVVYNRSTGKYVCMFKLYPDGTYATSYMGIATADSPRGPFTYSNKFLGASNTGSGDFALYQSGDDLYHIAVARGVQGRPSKFAKMRNDYKYPLNGGYTSMAGVTNSTEGQAIIKRGNTFHLFGSGSSGFNPNPARYFTSTSLAGPWTSLGNPVFGTNSVTGLGRDKTFGGQPTFINQVQGEDNQYIAMMDVWKPGNLGNSDYIWLPFTVDNSTNTFRLDWIPSWNLSWFGQQSSIVSGNIYNLKSVMSGKNLDNFGSMENGSLMGQYTPNNENNQKWKLTAKGNGFYKLTSQKSGKVLTNGNTNAQGAPAKQWTDNNNDTQTWKIAKVAGNRFTLQNKTSGKYLDNGNVSGNQQSVVQWNYNGGTTQQWIIE